MLSTNTTHDDARHFYLRDRNGAPIGVVVLVLARDAVRVGTSLCARTDAWDRERGRIIAHGRARGRTSLVAELGMRPRLRTILGVQSDNASRVRDVDMATAEYVYDSMVTNMILQGRKTGTWHAHAKK